MTTPSSEDKTVAEAMRLARECGDIERRACIGKAQGFDVRDAYTALESFLRTALAASGSKESPRPFDGLTDAEVDSIFEPLQDAPTMQFRYLAAEGITAALAMKWGAPAAVQTKGKDDSPSGEVAWCSACGEGVVPGSGQCRSKVQCAAATPQTAAPAAQPEPVAFKAVGRDGMWYVLALDLGAWIKLPHGTKLYTAAPPPAAQSDEALRKLLNSCREAMQESMRRNPSGTNWTHMIASIDAALAQKGTDHG